MGSCECIRFLTRAHQRIVLNEQSLLPCNTQSTEQSSWRQRQYRPDMGGRLPLPEGGRGGGARLLWGWVLDGGRHGHGWHGMGGGGCPPQYAPL
jgi:hypothetical protein